MWAWGINLWMPWHLSGDPGGRSGIGPFADFLDAVNFRSIFEGTFLAVHSQRFSLEQSIPGSSFLVLCGPFLHASPHGKVEPYTLLDHGSEQASPEPLAIDPPHPNERF